MGKHIETNYFGFDHVIYLVDDLDSAAARFAKLGFTICDRDDGDIAPHEHRLVCLRDGSFLEIVRFRDPRTLTEGRFSGFAACGGWVEYVVRIQDIENARALVVEAGLPASELVKRRRPLVTGQIWEVWLAYFGRGIGDPVRPMLAEDRTEHTLRVPAHALDHANGATGVSGLTFVTADLERAKASLQTFFVEGTSIDSNAALFWMNDRWVKVIQPVDPESPEARRLTTFGTCIFSVSISGMSGEIVLTNQI